MTVADSSDTQVRPFRIEVSHADLNDRLARSRWPDEPPEVGWDYSVALEHVRGLVEHWRSR